MKIKTSISIISGCLVIFLFLMLPVFLSMKSQKDDLVASFKGSAFSLKDVNNSSITEKSFENFGPTPFRLLGCKGVFGPHSVGICNSELPLRWVLFI